MARFCERVGLVIVIVVVIVIFVLSNLCFVGFRSLLQSLGGFNNERMSLEIACVAALLTHRTLVMPPAYPLYLLDSSALEGAVSHFYVVQFFS